MPPLPVTTGDCDVLLHDFNALRTTLSDERARLKRLERELVELQAALARSQAELAARRHGERRARHLAMHDCLTGLPNRRCFGEQLDRAVGRVKATRPGLTVLYVDLDDLKTINDRHGHDTGDVLLKIVGLRLRAAVRAHDLVSRLGGDEFACLLTDRLNREQLSCLACKLFDTVSAPVQIGERGIVVRPSIGIATCPTDGDTAAALLEHADGAMYCAKREQTGYAFFSDAPDCRGMPLATRTAIAPVSVPMS
jgi:diguanylate cyclase (GGDEF)-like protein